LYYGREWGELTAAERDELTTYFPDLG